MKKLLFTTILLTSSFLQASIFPVRSNPVPNSFRIAQEKTTDQEIQQKVQQIAKDITVRITSENNGGSGVLIAQKGDTYLILTNAHVVRKAAQILVQAPDGRKYTARKVDGGFSPTYDLALLQIESKSKYQLADLSDPSSEIEVNDKDIYSTGFPFDSNDLRITSGRISQLSDIPFEDGTQIGYTIDRGKKGIRQGMSGGPIFDGIGHFVGINTIGIAPILPNYKYNDGSKPIPKLSARYARANWGIPLYNFLTNVKADILYGYDNLPKVEHQVTPTGYMAKLNNKTRKMTVRIENSGGSGSGVIVAKEGDSYYVLTAKHVVQEEEKNTHQKYTNNQIITYDQDAHPVTSTVVAEGVDLAVIKFTSTSNYQVAKLGKYSPKDKDLAFVGGFPGRDKIHSPLWQWQLNPGFIFSQERGKLETQDGTSFANGGYGLIYSSISYAGMSGGPVFDTAGNVIGIHGEAETAGLSSLGISIQIFIGLAAKLQVAPSLLSEIEAHPAVLTPDKRKDVIATMENIPRPQLGDEGIRWLAYGSQLYRTRQYDRSIAAYETAISKGKVLLGNYGKAIALSKSKKHELAEKAIALAIAAVPNNKEDRERNYYLWNRQSTIFRRLYKYDEALKAIEIAIGLKPDDLNLLHEKAASLGQTGNHKAAIAIEDALIIGKKPEWYFYIVRAMSKSELGDNHGAIEDITSVIGLNPAYDDAYIYSAYIKSKSGDENGAAQDVKQALKINPSNDWAYKWRSDIKFGKGDTQGAIDDITLAIKLKPEEDGYYSDRAYIEMSNKDYSRARKDVDRAIQINPYSYTYYFYRGSINRDLGNNLAAIDDYSQGIKMNKFEGLGYQLRGMVKLENGDIKGALEDINQAISIKPNDAGFYSSRGIARSQKGDKKGAIDDYTKAIELKPKKAEYYSNRANEKSVIKDFKGAIDDYSKAIGLNRKNAGSYFLYRGDVKSKSGDDRGAIDDYKESIKFEPKSHFYYIYRANAKLHLGDNIGAVKDFSKAIELNPKIATTYKERAQAKLKIGDKEGAISDLARAIELDRKDDGVYLIRASLKSEMGDKKGTIEDLTKAIEINPKSTDYYILRAMTKLELGDKKGAIDDYTQFIKIEPNKTKHSTIYYKRGTLKLAQGDKLGAVSDYDRAIELTPKYALAYGSRGDIKNQSGDKQGAITDYTEAIKFNPEYDEAYFFRGNIKSELGNNSGAILDYDKAIEINPKFYYAYYSRGNAKYLLGDNLGAILDTDKAIAIKPNFANAYDNRGFLKLLMGREQEALPDLDKAIKLDPKMGESFACRGIIKETLGDKQGATADYKQAIKTNPQQIDEWKNQAELVRPHNATSYQKFQQMIQKLETGSKL